MLHFATWHFFNYFCRKSDYKILHFMKKRKKSKRNTLISNIIENSFGNLHDLVNPMVFLSTLFFFIGMSIDLTFYIISSNVLMSVTNIVSLILLLFLFFLMKKKKMSAEKIMTLHVITVAINLYITILYFASHPDETSIISLMVAVCIFIIPAMLGGMTSFRWLSLALTCGLIVCFAIAGILLENTIMLQNIPIIALVLVGTSITQLRLIAVIRKAEQEKIIATHDHDTLIRFFNVKPAQWELIKKGKGKLNGKDAAEMLDIMNNDVRNKMIDRLKAYAHSDEEIERPLRERFPFLTAGDMRLCCYIVRGMTVAEICELRDVKVSAVTVQRSRLRTKLGLDEKESLREFLESVVRRESAGKV